MNLVDHLKKENVILEGHFKLRSGKHSNLYVNKDAIYCNPVLFPKVMTQLLDLIQEKFDDFDIITGPAIAGAVLAAPLSLVLHKTFVYPEKVLIIKDEVEETWHSGVNRTKGYSFIMDFKRGYDKIIKDKKILLIEDVVTTGDSLLQTKNAVEKYGGIVVGSVVIWNRTGDDNILNMKMHSLIKEKVESWEMRDCPWCMDNKEDKIPLTDPKTGEIIETISVVDSVDNKPSLDSDKTLSEVIEESGVNEGTITFKRVGASFEELIEEKDIVDHPDAIAQEEENTITEEKIVL